MQSLIQENRDIIEEVTNYNRGFGSTTHNAISLRIRKFGSKVREYNKFNTRRPFRSKVIPTPKRFSASKLIRNNFY